MLHTTYEAPKRGFWSQIQRIKHKKRNFGVRYDVSSAKKGILELDTTYQAPKRGFRGQIQRIKHKKEDFSYFRVARKDQMEIFRASAWRRKTKWRIFVLPRGAERPNGVFSCFRATRKDQMENFYASAWRGKTQKRIFMLPRGAERPKKRVQVLQRGAERPKRDLSCFRVARKDQKEVLGVTAWRGKA